MQAIITRGKGQKMENETDVIAEQIVAQMESFLSQYEEMRQSEKARSMIYQYEFKNDLARNFGLNPHALYNASYATWGNVWKIAQGVYEKAERAYFAGQFPQFDDKTPFNEIYRAYIKAQCQRY